MPAIQRHGRWKSTKTVVEYIEAGRQFVDSAVNVLFDFELDELLSIPKYTPHGY